MRPRTLAAGCAAWCLLLAACETATSTPVRGPDGHWWYSIECRRSQAACYEEAGDVCPHGYIVAGEGGYSGTTVVANRYAVYAVPKYHGNMLVKCRTPQPKRAAPPHPAPSVADEDEPTDDTSDDGGSGTAP